MSYIQTNWKNGDVITADRLNNLEEGVVEALENGGGSADVGYSCTESVTPLLEESVTTSGPSTQGTLSYSQLIDADTLRVTFDGTEYIVDKQDMFGAYWYGGGMTSTGPNFSEYPFVLGSVNNGDNLLLTPSAGTYFIKIEALNRAVAVTDCFRAAVKEASSSDNSHLIFRTMDDNIYTLGVLSLFQGNYSTALAISNLSNVLFWKSDRENLQNLMTATAKTVRRGSAGMIDGIEFAFERMIPGQNTLQVFSILIKSNNTVTGELYTASLTAE